MNKKSILLAASILIAGSVSAQKLDDGYIAWPNSGDLATYVSAWNGGSGTLTVNGKTWEDEEFFISRVKPRTRISNRVSQVYNSITDLNDKRCTFWVPIGNHFQNEAEFHSNALPNGTMDQEVFSMWSYLDHYGNWTAPWGWSPAAFSDVAHKNGVAVSGVASVPWGSISGGWKSSFQAICNLSADAVGKFLYYHGVDGLGYNSEWTGYSPSGLKTLHDGLKTYMASRNPIWEVMWYAGTNDSGGCTFDVGLSGFTGLFNSASMFLNYNWNNDYTWSGVTTAENMGRDPFLVYAGMNMQGAETTSNINYGVLKNYKVSIGLWGAHDYNMFWQGRNSKGSSPEAMQRTYLNTCEQWFGNGPRNPAIRIATNNNSGHRPTDDWSGFSSMMAARSTINHVIKNEPFYTYFNLGNGKFFNYKGERMNDNEWYNIGIQDFLPTWRWWFAPTFMDGDVSASEVNLAADFTWDDAYFGGSCLQITGTDTDEYLHLFKTNIEVATGQRITVRYKLLEGEADVSLVYSAGNTPKTAAVTRKFINAADATTIQDKSYDEGWQTFTLPLTGTYYTTVNNAKGNIGVIALRFQNAKNLKFLLGELSITAGANTTTPSAPQLVSSKVLKSSYSGVDGKLIWKMANNKSVGEPVYNSDVNTSMFKIYSREEGGEAVLLGATTSWAAIAFRAPNTDDNKKIQFGVSAVAADMKTESDIVWSPLYSKGSYIASEDVYLSKTTIKPGESFEVGYVDQRHASSNWELVNPATNTTVASGSGTKLEVTSGLSTVGGYDLYINRGTTSQRQFAYYVQVSDEAVGAVPEIYTTSVDGSAVTEASADVKIELTDTPSLSYTGRDADGNASRGLSFIQNYIGVANRDLQLGAQQSFSIAGWFKFNDFPASSFNFFNASNKAGAWPQNTWGWCWNSVSPEGVINCTFRGNSSDTGSPGELRYSFPNTKLQPNIWMHMAYVCEYTGGGFRLLFYINGVKQESTWFQYATGNGGSYRQTGTTDDICTGQTHPIASTDDIYFGGPKYQGSAVDGVVDDFQIWTKAMTEAEVKASMNGLNPNALPAGVACFWDYEDDFNSDYSFSAKGSKAGVKGYAFDFIGGASEGTASKQYSRPTFSSGSPFLTGTAYPVVTTASWKDTDRKTVFAKGATTNEGKNGSAVATFQKAGDHTVTLTLENTYGSQTKTFPVFTIEEPAAIDGIIADEAGVEAYTIENILFVEFANGGDYTIEVYNMSGMLVGHEALSAVAGQNARITLGSAGVYLVKVIANGQPVRTIKVLSK